MQVNHAIFLTQFFTDNEHIPGEDTDIRAEFLNSFLYLSIVSKTPIRLRLLRFTRNDILELSVRKADKRQIVAVDQVEKQVAFLGFPRLAITEDEANLGMDVAAMDVILHSL